MNWGETARDFSSSVNKLAEILSFHNVKDLEHFINSNKDPKDKMFLNLSKKEVTSFINIPFHLQSYISSFNTLKLSIGSIEITLNDVRPYTELKFCIEKLETKILELVNITKSSFPTDYKVSLIITKK